MAGRALTPVSIVIFSFVLLIAVGTALLSIPGAARVPISFTDALFTATSSVCVTGLIVLDTAKDFTLPGQIIILGLIQLGGLGIMTVSLALILLVSEQLSVSWQFTLMEMYGKGKKLPIRLILKNIIVFTAISEGAVMILLFPGFLRDYPPHTALWHSLFHAVSSFCNAGFSTFTSSLIAYAGDWYMITVISASIILGGLGFLVLSDIIRFRKYHLVKAFTMYSLHTKVVLVTSILLLLAGTLFFYVSEQENIIRGMSLSKQLCVSFFHSVSCRTAGFNSIPLTQLSDNTLFFMILLMVIGGSPGSIAGGIKTTTAWVICAIIIGRIRRQDQLVFWKRAISSGTVERSTTLLILALFFISAMTLVLSSFNNLPGDTPFIDILFETASAFGTVGLSTGVTGTLSSGGKIAVVATMFVGRLGPLTFLTLVSSGRKKSG
ncbi:MAG: TrkH family potassium uptake protein, partial [Spirochaetota bacterium]